MDSPRILYVTSCWPHDKSHGGQLRALQIGRALKQMGRVSIAIIGAHEVGPDVKVRTADEFEVQQELKISPFPSRTLRERAAAVFDPDFINIHGLVADADAEARLIASQKNFDLTWFFKLRTANYFATSRWCRTVVDVDDLPSTMEKNAILDQDGIYRHIKSRFRTFALKKHERNLDRRFDALGVCSEDDKKLLRGCSPVHVIPNGVPRPVSPPVRSPAQPPRIGFIGLYNYEPNFHGVNWFVRNCWDLIKAEVPGVRLRLIGQDSDGPLKPRDASVDGLGWVANPAEEIATWSVMIVPIRSGAGTRVKIADAFSRKCPLVSTRFGALGYDVQNERELLLADDPREFASACISLINKPDVAGAMAERAFGRFLDNWTWEAINPRVWEMAEDSLRLNFGR